MGKDTINIQRYQLVTKLAPDLLRNSQQGRRSAPGTIWSRFPKLEALKG